MNMRADKVSDRRSRGDKSMKKVSTNWTDDVSRVKTRSQTKSED